MLQLYRKVRDFGALAVRVGFVSIPCISEWSSPEYPKMIRKLTSDHMLVSLL